MPRGFVSFFSGALGLDIGLENAGLEPLAANEVDTAACATITRNRPRIKLYPHDIRDIKPHRLMADLGLRKGELFAIVGGPPCQAFSTAGRRLGLNDERGNVFLHFIELIKGVKPKYAVFENVRGLLSAPLMHIPHRERRGKSLCEETKAGGALLYILRELEQAGYRTTFTLYNTANYGVPQIRERLIFFASREGVELPFIPPTHSESGKPLPRWRTVRDAIGHLQGRPCASGKFPEGRLRYYRLLKQGQNWRDLPRELQKEAMGNSYFAGGGKTGFYRRLAWDKPSPTLVTSPTMPATDLCHPEELRPLSIEEYTAIQTFPDDFELAGKLTDKYRQLGNAVPCMFAEAIGKHLVQVDENVALIPSSGQHSRYAETDHISWRQKVEPHQLPF